KLESPSVIRVSLQPTSLNLSQGYNLKKFPFSFNVSTSSPLIITQKGKDVPVTFNFSGSLESLTDQDLLKSQLLIDASIQDQKANGKLLFELKNPFATSQENKSLNFQVIVNGKIPAILKKLSHQDSCPLELLGENFNITSSFHADNLASKLPTLQGRVAISSELLKEEADCVLDNNFLKISPITLSYTLPQETAYILAKQMKLQDAPLLVPPPLQIHVNLPNMLLPVDPQKYIAEAEFDLNFEIFPIEIKGLKNLQSISIKKCFSTLSKAKNSTAQFAAEFLGTLPETISPEM